MRKLLLLLIATSIVFADPPSGTYGWCKANYESGYFYMSYGDCFYSVTNGQGMQCWLGSEYGDNGQGASIAC